MPEHHYQLTLEWTGNAGTGTSSYHHYGRDHRVLAEGKPPLHGSAEPRFRGDPNRYNPEELLVASLSACHMLWYLHLCSEAGVVVTSYHDHPSGVMAVDGHGGRFTRAILRPSIAVTNSDMIAQARRLHDRAHRACFIANSVRFPVEHVPTVDLAPDDTYSIR